MTRNAHDREDLLRDARGLSPRMQLEITSPPGPRELFAGFRGESLSLYFGQALVFHFNGRGQLRRAFVADLLLKADDGRLAAMRRERTHDETRLVCQSLTEVQERTLLADLEHRLLELDEAIAAGEYRLVGEVPADGGAMSRLEAWLNSRGRIELADSPHVR
ncbi:MAG: hypothetical protein JNL18_15765 [Planctomycetaceae bacterium]|nr:hypothetical protein [Planctomycetaceae bacterium]